MSSPGLVDGILVAVARRVRRWADRVLAERADESSTIAQESQEPAEPDDDNELDDPEGPPAHWVEMVRARAPHLLPAEYRDRRVASRASMDRRQRAPRRQRVTPAVEEASAREGEQVLDHEAAGEHDALDPLPGGGERESLRAGAARSLLPWFSRALRVLTKHPAAVTMPEVKIALRTPTASAEVAESDRDAAGAIEAAAHRDAWEPHDEPDAPVRHDDVASARDMTSSPSVARSDVVPPVTASSVSQRSGASGAFRATPRAPGSDEAAPRMSSAEPASEPASLSSHVRERSHVSREASASSTSSGGDAVPRTGSAALPHAESEAGRAAREATEPPSLRRKGAGSRQQARERRDAVVARPGPTPTPTRTWREDAKRREPKEPASSVGRYGDPRLNETAFERPAVAPTAMPSSLVPRAATPVRHATTSSDLLGPPIAAAAVGATALVSRRPAPVKLEPDETSWPSFERAGDDRAHAHRESTPIRWPRLPDEDDLVAPSEMRTQDRLWPELAVDDLDALEEPRRSEDPARDERLRREQRGMRWSERHS